MDIYKKIVEFWQNKLNLEVYEQGQVPDTAILPYATITMSAGKNYDSDTLTVFTWHEKDKNLERIAYANKIFNAISLGGERIKVKNGVIVFRRTGKIDLYGDEGTIANRYSYEVTFYNA